MLKNHTSACFSYKGLPIPVQPWMVPNKRNECVCWMAKNQLSSDDEDDKT